MEPVLEVGWVVGSGGVIVTYRVGSEMVHNYKKFRRDEVHRLMLLLKSSDGCLKVA